MEENTKKSQLLTGASFEQWGSESEVNGSYCGATGGARSCAGIFAVSMAPRKSKREHLWR